MQKFGQLTLGKIIKIVDTRCQILRLKCTKFNFGWGSALRGGGGEGRERELEWRDETTPLPFLLIHISGYVPDLGCLSPESDQTKNLEANGLVQTLRISIKILQTTRP